MTRLPTPKAFETTHVTVRCNNQEFLFNLHDTYSDMVSWINTLPIMYNVDIHHLVMMSNHMHILLTPNEDNLGRARSYFLGNLAKFLNYRSQRKNHIFGGRYKPTVIQNPRHYINVIRYIYQNPVRANISKQAINYPYSSLGQYLGYKNDGLIIKPDDHTRDLFEFGMNGRQVWLDQIDHILFEEDVELLRDSFSRRSFKLSRRQLFSLQDRKTRLTT